MTRFLTATTFVVCTAVVMGCQHREDSVPDKGSNEAVVARSESEVAAPGADTTSARAAQPSVKMVKLGTSPPAFFNTEVPPLTVVELLDVPAEGMKQLRLRFHQPDGTEVAFYRMSTVWKRIPMPATLSADNSVEPQVWDVTLDGWDHDDKYKKVWEVDGFRVSGPLSLQHAVSVMVGEAADETRVAFGQPVILEGRDTPKKTDFFRGGHVTANLPAGRRVVICYPPSSEGQRKIGFECRKAPAFQHLHYFRYVLIE